MSETFEGRENLVQREIRVYSLMKKMKKLAEEIPPQEMADATVMFLKNFLTENLVKISIDLRWMTLEFRCPPSSVRALQDFNSKAN